MVRRAEPPGVGPRAAAGWEGGQLQETECTPTAHSRCTPPLPRSANPPRPPAHLSDRAVDVVLAVAGLAAREAPPRVLLPAAHQQALLHGGVQQDGAPHRHRALVLVEVVVDLLQAAGSGRGGAGWAVGKWEEERGCVRVLNKQQAGRKWAVRTAAPAAAGNALENRPPGPRPAARLSRSQRVAC